MEPKILSIDTSCDETSAAVTEGLVTISNVVWSQASLHAKFGGVMPSLAKRQHQEHLDWIINKAMSYTKFPLHKLDAIAVTTGPGLAIALEVGITKAKQICRRYHKPLITVNHLEGHILSSLAKPKSMVEVKPKSLHYTSGEITKKHTVSYPAFGLVISGGNTEIVLIKKIGDYTSLAKTHDDALGEALDKAARMLGFGYPGAALLEKLAKHGKTGIYKLPIPMVGREDAYYFSYSGLKTALYKVVEKENMDKTKMENLAAAFQDVAFKHLIRVVKKVISDHPEFSAHHLLVGGGVAANVEIRKRLRTLAKELNIQVHFPYSRRLYGDNAAMIGIAAYFKYSKGECFNENELSGVERDPRLQLGPGFAKVA